MSTNSANQKAHGSSIQALEGNDTNQKSCDEGQNDAAARPKTNAFPNGHAGVDRQNVYAGARPKTTNQKARVSSQSSNDAYGCLGRRGGRRNHYSWQSPPKSHTVFGDMYQHCTVWLHRESSIYSENSWDVFLGSYYKIWIILEGGELDFCKNIDISSF